MKTKYIIVKSNGLEWGIIFPEVLVHKDIARCCQTSGIKIVSAGFCHYVKGEAGYGHLEDDRWEAYGESESLRLKSRPEDSEILTKSFCNPY